VPARWWRQAHSPSFLLHPGVTPSSPTRSTLGAEPGLLRLPTSLVLLSDVLHGARCFPPSPHPRLHRSSIPPPSLPPTPGSAWSPTALAVLLAAEQGTGGRQGPLPWLLRLEQGRKPCPIVGR